MEKVTKSGIQEHWANLPVEEQGRWFGERIETYAEHFGLEIVDDDDDEPIGEEDDDPREEEEE